MDRLQKMGGGDNDRIPAIQAMASWESFLRARIDTVYFPLSTSYNTPII